MLQAARKGKQRSALPDQAAPAQPSAEPADPPAALLPRGPGLTHEEPSPALEGAGAKEAQLALPLEIDAPPPPDAPPLAERRKPRRSRSKGFVPVTRDPDVARSYSDNVALDYAVARGLAQALTSLPPEELAALKARVARTPRNSNNPSSRS